eukprot:6213031-Pleurochrysis_carterae.AAC.3
MGCVWGSVGGDDHQKEARTLLLVLPLSFRKPCIIEIERARSLCAVAGSYDGVARVPLVL